MDDSRPWHPFDPLGFARDVVRREAAELTAAADRLPPALVEACDVIRVSTGRLGLCGVGKAGDAARKLAGTLNSTGTRSYVLDPTRAAHGDLGMVAPDDVLVLISHSGESEEMVRLLPALGDPKRLIALTSAANSRVAKACGSVVCYGPVGESCPRGLAPSASTAVILAVGDAMAFLLAEWRGFSAEDFAKIHPAGSLGQRLAPVESAMRPPEKLRTARPDDPLRMVLHRKPESGRRAGAILVVDPSGRLRGIFTDSDLARLFEDRREAALDGPIGAAMTSNPIVLRLPARLGDAVAMMRERKISELPVTDLSGMLLGMIDITDVVGVPAGAAVQGQAARAA